MREDGAAPLLAGATADVYTCVHEHSRAPGQPRRRGPAGRVRPAGRHHGRRATRRPARTPRAARPERRRPSTTSRPAASSFKPGERPPPPDLVVAMPVGTRSTDSSPRCVDVLALDSSALLARYLGGPTRQVVLDAMAADDVWCASSLALSEVLVLIERVGGFEAERDALRRAVRDDWERVHVVPVDQPVSIAPPSWEGRNQCAPSTPSISPPPTVCRGPDVLHVRLPPDPRCACVGIRRHEHLSAGNPHAPR